MRIWPEVTVVALRRTLLISHSVNLFLRYSYVCEGGYEFFNFPR